MAVMVLKAMLVGKMPILYPKAPFGYIYKGFCHPLELINKHLQQQNQVFKYIIHILVKRFSCL